MTFKDLGVPFVAQQQQQESTSSLHSGSSNVPPVREEKVQLSGVRAATSSPSPAPVRCEDDVDVSSWARAAEWCQGTPGTIVAHGAIILVSGMISIVVVMVSLLFIRRATAISVSFASDTH